MKASLTHLSGFIFQAVMSLKYETVKFMIRSLDCRNTSFRKCRFPCLHHSGFRGVCEPEKAVSHGLFLQSSYSILAEGLTERDSPYSKKSCKKNCNIEIGQH